jgi:hypothetical protein
MVAGTLMPTLVLLSVLWAAGGALPQHGPAAKSSQASPEAAARQRQRATVRAKAETTVSKLEQAADPAVRVAACEARGRKARSTACTDTLKSARQLSDAGASVDALAARVAAGDANAAAELRALSASIKDKDPAAAIEGIRALPGNDGADTLQEMTASDKPEIRQLAADALAEKDPAAARELVKQAMAGQGRKDVAFQAALGLAAGGDSELMTQVAGWLPTLQGRDRFKAAEALARQGVTEAVHVLSEIARNGDDELLRLNAAAALVDLDRAAAEAAVARALESDNIWVRGEAASLAPRLGDEWLDRVQALLDDPSEWVRLRAAAAVVKAAPHQ